MTDRGLANELIAALMEWGIRVDGADPLDFSLISSGAMDSLALFRLSVWIEAKIGRPVNLATLDLTTDWDTPARIVRFIEATRQTPAP